MTDKEKGKFTQLTDVISYNGGGGIIQIESGNYELNGVKMEAGKAYNIKNGDIIQGLGFEPLTVSDVKWSFK